MYDETNAVSISDLKYRACQHTNGLFCRIHAPFQPLSNLPSFVTALYAKNNQQVKEQCSLVISHMPHILVPTAAASNLWFIPLNPQTVGITMTIICQDKTTSTVPLQQPFHILSLFHVCSTTSIYFYLPPCYKDHSMVMNVSIDTAGINAINISTL